jgi:hypothetical protein
MKRILLGTAISVLAFGLAAAQTPAPGTSSTNTTPSSSMGPGSSMGAPATPNPMGQQHDSGKAAASGDSNQAVVTTGTNADQPAKGRNSFTRKQAAHRIASKGYTHVTGLKKDSDGVWRGTGTKDGAPVQVWLDYKGNVGQQS